MTVMIRRVTRLRSTPVSISVDSVRSPSTGAPIPFFRFGFSFWKACTTERRMAATSMAILALDGAFFAAAVAIDALQTSVGGTGIEQRHAPNQVERAGELVIELIGRGRGCRIAFLALGSLRAGSRGRSRCGCRRNDLRGGAGRLVVQRVIAERSAQVGFAAAHSLRDFLDLRRLDLDIRADAERLDRPARRSVVAR